MTMMQRTPRVRKMPLSAKKTTRYPFQWQTQTVTHRLVVIRFQPILHNAWLRPICSRTESHFITFVFILANCNRHRDEYCTRVFFRVPDCNQKHARTESPCQRKRRPRQTRLLFARRRTEYYSAHCCQRKRCKVQVAIMQ